MTALVLRVDDWFLLSIGNLEVKGNEMLHLSLLRHTPPI